LYSIVGPKQAELVTGTIAKALREVPNKVSPIFSWACKQRLDGENDFQSKPQSTPVIQHKKTFPLEKDKQLPSGIHGVLPDSPRFDPISGPTILGAVRRMLDAIAKLSSLS
jgi:hypothetical protein